MMLLVCLEAFPSKPTVTMNGNNSLFDKTDKTDTNLYWLHLILHHISASETKWVVSCKTALASWRLHC